MTAKTSPSKSAYLSISFDFGGCIGAILAGYVADRSGASAITCIVMLIAAIPSLFFYYLWGTKTTATNEILQFIAGIFVNGPYLLIATAVSIELATKVTSKSAMATVSAIIDGTGSIGAAIGPFLAGVVSKWGWNYVFYMVMLADLLAVLSLVRISLNDFVRLKNSFKKA
jgi:OPA family glycerol-3-phosphate transporter-like MFS transporter 1/2